MKHTLTEQDFARAAAELHCDVAAIKAVCEVEAPKGGFNSDGTTVILFEGHKFHEFTDGKFDRTYPTLSYPKWDRQFYGKNQVQERSRFMAAAALDARSAMLSTSWGKFQIMGFNHAAAGYSTVEKFVSAMNEDEGRHLDAFVSIIKAWRLDDELREGRWSDFARRYNGPAYAQNRYDLKLANAFNRYSAA